MICPVTDLTLLHRPVRHPAVYAAITAAVKKKKPLSVLRTPTTAWWNEVWEPAFPPPMRTKCDGGFKCEKSRLYQGDQ